MTKNRHILFLPAWYPNNEDPMFGLFIQRHAEALAQQNKVSVLCFQSISNDKKLKRILVSEENGVFVIRVQFSKPAGLWGKALFILHFFIGLHKGFKILKEKRSKPDLCLVNVLTRMGLVALILKGRFKIPYFILEHWSRYLPYPATYKGRLRKIITRKVVKKSSGLASVSQFLLNAMAAHQLTHPNTTVISNVVDDKVFFPQKLQAANSKISFLSLTCFEDKSKNLSLLIEAIEILSTFRNDFIAVIAGDGKDFEYIHSLATQKKLLNHIQFPGLIQGPVVAQFINQSAFLVISSRYENMPVVISEAFSCGKPVVSTRVGGISEVVNLSNGVLVDSNDAKALAEAISYMLDHHSNYDVLAIRNFATARFSPQAVNDQFNHFFDNQCRQ